MTPAGSFQFYRNTSIQGIELCEIRNSLHRFPNHAHDDIYAFSLMEGCGSYWHSDDKSDTLVLPGEVAVINPGQLHSGAPQRGKSSSYLMIYINSSVIEKTASDILEKDAGLPEFERVIFKNTEAAAYFRQFYNCIRTSGENLELEHALFGFLGSLITSDSVRNPGGNAMRCDDQLMKHAAELLDENLGQKFTLGELAETLDLSRYHFIRTFKRYSGVPPHIYRTQKRIAAAKKLILKGYPFADIALQTGFTDQSHFTNQFKKYTGATPSQYLAVN